MRSARWLALVLASLLLTLAACGGDEGSDTDTTGATDVTEASDVAADQALPDADTAESAGETDAQVDTEDTSDTSEDAADTAEDSAEDAADTADTAEDTADTAEETAEDTGEPASMLCQVADEDADGVALLSGQTVTVEGIVMSDGGLLANKKLRTHLEDEHCGVAIFADETVFAGIVEAIGPLVAGDRLRVTGSVSQLGTTDESLGAFDGLTRVLIEDAALVERLADGQALPEPVLLDLPTIVAEGDAYEGLLVKVEGLTKAEVDAATWVTPADKGTYVDAVDGAGNGPIKLRLSNGKNTGGYGDDPGTASFGVVGFLREDQTVTPETAGAAPLSFEIWPRGAADILP